MSGRIRVNQRVIYSGRGHYKLVCGVGIRQARNGDLLSWWLSGDDNEPAADNCVLMSRSSDGGKTWSEPETLLPAGEMATALTAMYGTSDGRLIAWGARWPYDRHYTDWYYFRMESADSGRTWSERLPLVLHDNHACLGTPIALANGELLFPASFFDRRPIPLTASPARLAEAASEEEALSMPAVADGERGAGKFGTHLHGCSVFISPDENATTLEEHGRIANRPLGLLEPTCLQLRDGRVVMLMRAEWGGFLWRAESADNGRTWTPAWETDIPNPTTLAKLIRLADGRIALIHNATGAKGTTSVRNPLSIWVSEDELRTWSIREDVIATSDHYRPDRWPAGLDQLAYPDAILLDGRLVVVYDRNRREALFVEVEID